MTKNNCNKECEFYKKGICTKIECKFRTNTNKCRIYSQPCPYKEKGNIDENKYMVINYEQ